MDIHILGAHNVESKKTKCVSVVIDNILAVDAGGLTSGLSITEQNKLKAILLTHQHYDHIRDIPTLALNLSTNGNGVDVYTTLGVRRVIETHLLNGTLYPKFQESTEVKPVISFKLIEPYKAQTIEVYEVLAVPVNHSDITVGYQISDNEGGVVFYTADTGPGLSDCWQCLSPRLLIVDVTVPNRLESFAKKTGHLTPALLYNELSVFGDLKGYLPKVITVHMNPSLEKEIEEELAVVSRTLSASVTLASEGMRLVI
ncbi:MBL fold metallo-hydrolase [Chloroflexota bacterium]